MGDDREKYLLTRPLGRGAMGTVYEATHRGLRRQVAVKVLHAQHAGNEALAKRFSREAIAVSQLRSKYVVRIFDSDVNAQGEPFIVMELLSGVDLAARFRAGPCSVEQVADWVAQICSAIGEAHGRGIVHRDLKPSNIFICKDDESVRILDFGIAKILSGMELTAGSEILGTPGYIAPEVLLGASFDGRADLYAIGVIAYRALCGHLPCQADKDKAHPFTAMIATVNVAATPLSVHRPDVAVELGAAVMKALEKQPDNRYATARDMAAAFALFGSGAQFFEDFDQVSVPPLQDVSSFPPPGPATAAAPEIVIDFEMATRTLPTSAVTEPADRERRSRRSWRPVAALGVAGLGLMGWGLATWARPNLERGAVSAAPASTPTTSSAQPVAVPPLSVDPAPVPSVASADAPSVAKPGPTSPTASKAGDARASDVPLRAVRQPVSATGAQRRDEPLFIE